MTAPNPPFDTRTLAYGTAAIAEAAALIAAGQPVAIPTETVYGLAADATDPTAVARIYAAKGRPSFNPLIVHVPDLAAARRIAEFDDEALALAGAFWPGPLTLVLPLRGDAGIASLVTAGLDTVAVRVPAHRAIRALLAATGKPLAAPSANASGGISPTCAAHVMASLGKRIALIVDDGATQAGLESTIVHGRDVLRPGPVTRELIGELFSGDGGDAGMATAAAETGATEAEPSPEWPRAVPSPVPPPPGARPVAPGQLCSHYAPAKHLRLHVTSRVTDEYLIGFGDIAGDINLSPAADLTEAAANLFDALHRADASDRARIAVAPIPDKGIGAAINDRLRRAACRD